MTDLNRMETLRALCCCAALMVIVGTSCDGSEMVKGDNLYYLDAKKTSITQKVETADRLEEGCKFVQVEVAKVTNPKRYGLTFEVRYKSGENEETLLGTFSLYPADNPGKFIVPSKGRVRNRGEIVLTMVISDKIEPNDAIQVGVKRITFLK